VLPQNFCVPGQVQTFDTQLDPPLHSPLPQQPSMGMHPPLHFLCVLSQVKSQLVPSQVADEYWGTGHGLHDWVPQPFTLVSSRQTPEQLCVPPGHCPEHAIPSGRHVPTHGRWPCGHIGVHWPPTQSTVPPVGAVHGLHDCPQVEAEVSLAQSAPHGWVPLTQVIPAPAAPAVPEPPAPAPELPFEPLLPSDPPVPGALPPEPASVPPVPVPPVPVPSLPLPPL
jgi:hypothetical protein